MKTWDGSRDPLWKSEIDRLVYQLYGLTDVFLAYCYIAFNVNAIS